MYMYMYMDMYMYMYMYMNMYMYMYMSMHTGIHAHEGGKLPLGTTKKNVELDTSSISGALLKRNAEPGHPQRMPELKLIKL